MSRVLIQPGTRGIWGWGLIWGGLIHGVPVYIAPSSHDSHFTHPTLAHFTMAPPPVELDPQRQHEEMQKRRRVEEQEEQLRQEAVTRKAAAKARKN